MQQSIFNGPIKSERNGFDEYYSGRIQDEVEKIKIIREAVGPDFDLILEAHRGMTKPEAILFGNEVAKYRPMVFEDPERRIILIQWLKLLRRFLYL